MQRSRRTKGQARWCIYFLPRPLNSKNLEIAYYYSAFCYSSSAKSNLNMSANSVKLFLREPLPPAFAGMTLKSDVAVLRIWKNLYGETS